MKYLAALAVTGVVVTTVPTGCFLQEASDRAACDRALELVCACSSKPCDSATPPAIVTRLRKCEDVRDDGYDLPTCIHDRSDPNEYCRILDGLTAQSQETCSLECNLDTACDQEAACHEFQSSKCQIPVPVPDGGSDAQTD